ncbi:hypothetical protein, partial [Anaerovibrio sp. RM50]|uniref:hypothetical protein n=1 Tax=Anaerovibrio sp. RM50 TaxID=1200557 RepID=UPI000561681E
ATGYLIQFHFVEFKFLVHNIISLLYGPCPCCFLSLHTDLGRMYYKKIKKIQILQYSRSNDG